MFFVSYWKGREKGNTLKVLPGTVKTSQTPTHVLPVCPPFQTHREAAGWRKLRHSFKSGYTEIILFLLNLALLRVIKFGPKKDSHWSKLNMCNIRALFILTC